ncbi:hypothetical protein LTR84_005804 [Exophiala bonariae]|uniref:FAD-binding domain-containing protein n=1 Tax=Exophiala bonariae TaxID=1690606 RepID=A0AAV9N694_9EURO|nr:hypothetical protein LTR84_005804 [Exophiala bonariae]
MAESQRGLVLATEGQRGITLHPWNRVETLEQVSNGGMPQPRYLQFTLKYINRGNADRRSISPKFKLTAMSTFNTDVLVVGAGPAGLTAAALLARQGTASITITKYSSTANGPRAHITNQRTVEIMRDLGLESRVYQVGDKSQDVGEMVWVTSLGDRELSRCHAWGSGTSRKGDYEASSPCATVNLSQHFFEPIIHRGALDLGADIRFSSELVKVEQDGEGVTATVLYRPTGHEYLIRARYLLAADGGRSTVAQQVGIELDGRSRLAYAINVHIEADLTHLTSHRPGVLYWTNHPGREYFFGSGTFALVRRWNEWMVQFSYDPETDHLEASDEALLPRLRAAIGDPNVEIKIKGLGKWEMNSLIAQQYRKGRVFIAGDAAHRHTPANGLGSNTSIQDSYNLAWKLSMVVRGEADDALLDSYEAERLPVGRQIVARATKSMGLASGVPASLGIRAGQSEEEGWAAIDSYFAPTPDGRRRREEVYKIMEDFNYGVNGHGVEMGQRYESNAVVGDGTPFPAYEKDSELYYQPTTHPGAYLPHVWLTRRDKPVSTLDLVPADTWTLITGIGGSSWLDAAKQVSSDLGFNIATSVIGLGLEVSDPHGDWLRFSEISDGGALLIRPDKYIAWRAREMGKDPLSELRNVFRALLRPGAII